jgi:hypothetical protein
VRTSKNRTSAHVALREATRALTVPRDGTTPGALTGNDYQALAADVAATLDAVAGLLRSTDTGVGLHAPTHGLLSVAEHVDLGAVMARHAGGDHDQTSSTSHLEPEPCATTDA